MQKDTNVMPQHIAMILDGNRRWAKNEGKNVIEGHKAGAATILEMIRHLYKRGVHTVTLWVFSTENWNRSPLQVKALMMLFQNLADPYFEEAVRHKARFVHLGRKDRIPTALRKKIEEYEKKSADFTDHGLNVALDYGGRDEFLRAVQNIVHNNVPAASITEETISAHLDTRDAMYPQPDLIIRTGGEQRMSGFLIWQAAYAEYFFLKKIST
ncbi:MAG: Isoprenyl transferase [Microgenomates bacterium OLB23]|nr:MAG: Isoprenyl transferase [Microgenomates bacterium OLB23]